jgi:hypothetical protein
MGANLAANGKRNLRARPAQNQVSATCQERSTGLPLPCAGSTSHRAAAEAGGGNGAADVRPVLTFDRWNRELRWSRNYPEWLAHLLAADAVVALDGGIGTVSAAVVWAARRVAFRTLFRTTDGRTP